MSDPTDIEAVVDAADTIAHRLDPETAARLAAMRVDTDEA